jgi:cell division septation protein DedD
MMQEQNTPDLDSAGEEDPRKQLWIRAGVAIGLISVLLGGLAVFDRLSRPPVQEEVVAPTRPIAPAQVASDAGRDVPPDVLKAGAPGTDAAPGSDVPPLPAEGSVPPLPGPDKDEGAVRGERGGRIAEGTRPLVRAPAPGHAAAVPPAQSQAQTPAPMAPQKPAQQVVPQAPAAPAAPAPVVVTARPETAPQPLAPAAVTAPPAAKAPAAPAAPAAPSTPAAPAAPAEGQAGYALQVGVFATPAQAAALQARLSAEGIPSRLETRVVVGPFADRRDALAAQARLRDKGFSAGELIPFRR